MMRIENHCCDCATPAYPCRRCEKMHTAVFYCDRCGFELDDEAYEVDGDFICLDCLIENFKIDREEWEAYHNA